MASSVHRFSYYAKLRDVQTLAMLACICQLQCHNIDEYFRTIHKSDPVTKSPLTPTPNKKHLTVREMEYLVINWSDLYKPIPNKQTFTTSFNIEANEM